MPGGQLCHKKRKKGFRHRFYRRKNEERSSVQAANKENKEPNSHEEETSEQIALPRDWQQLDQFRYCKISEGGSGLKVTVSLTFNSHWEVHVGGRRVPDTSDVLESLPFTDGQRAFDFMKAIDGAYLCIGNPEEMFVRACKEKGGIVKGEKGKGEVVAEVDGEPVVDGKGNEFDCTVRRRDCSVLCVQTSGQNHRCKSCQAFRVTLRGMVWRRAHRSENRTSASSHTRYCDLTSTEKSARLSSLHTALRSSTKRVKRLQAKVDKLIERKAIHLESEDADDISHVMAEVDPTVRASFPEDSPQHIFWEQQLKYNSLKDKRQMRWHPLVIRFALNLRYLSGTAYQAVRQFGIKLPSERTLYDYTHWTNSHSGIQYEFVEQFLLQVQEGVSCGHYHTALSMDEMKLKSGLVFKHRQGVLAGFVNLGNCNREIELMVNGGDDDDDDDDDDEEDDDDKEESEVSDCPLAEQVSLLLD